MHKTETTKSLLPSNWVLPFPKSLFTENHSDPILTSSVSAHLGAPKALLKVRCRSPVERLPLGQHRDPQPGGPFTRQVWEMRLCMAQQSQTSPLLQSDTQPATSTQYRSQ